MEAEPPQDGAAPDPVQDDAAPEAEPVAPPPPARRGGVLAPLIGGVLAAAVGYGAAQFIRPDGWPFPGSVDPVAIEQSLEALRADTDDLRDEAAAREGEIAELRNALDSAQAAARDTADIDARIADLSARLETFEQRLTTLEARPVAEAVVSPEATAAYERQLAEMRAMLEDEVARLEQAQEQAASERAEANAAAAVARLRTAIDAGQPFAALLPDIGMPVPEALDELARSGVPTLASLQDAFPDVARAALAASVAADTPDSTEGRVELFLRSQLGLRSLAPRAGDDPDAVLSRAEALVRDGDLSAALDEIATLPEPGRAAMADWRARAQSRVTALGALDDMLNANR